MDIVLFQNDKEWCRDNMHVKGQKFRTLCYPLYHQVSDIILETRNGSR